MPSGILLSSWMNYNYTACCWFPTSNIMYFHHSSDKSALKVTDCTVQSAEYCAFTVHCMLLVSYIQQYFYTSITVLTDQLWKLLIALFKVPNTGVFTVYQHYLLLYIEASLCQNANRTRNMPHAHLKIHNEPLDPK